jgi:predicted O-methyltransferase YrrM
MSAVGTAAHAGHTDLPPLVTAAVVLAERTGFPYSCRPEQGRLLRVLAGGIGAGVIGETGTGCGVGLAWLASGAVTGTRLVSVERDAGRAASAREVFADRTDVTIVTGDWRDLPGAPFDLLVLDGGGQGKGSDEPLDPAGWVRPGGLLVIDDFTPMSGWPPVHEGRPDAARLHWLRHPRLAAAELRIAPDSATIVATFLG